MICYGCHAEGHIEANCPNTSFDTTGKPPWCGICEEESRLLDLGDTMARCQVCNPKGHQQLKQHRKCPRCHVTVHVWDHSPCGQHSGPTAPDRRPERETIDGLPVVAGLRDQLEQARRAAQEPQVTP